MASSSKLTTEAWDSFNVAAQSAALQATRHAASLPADVGFHRTMDSTVASDLDILSARVLSTTNRLLSFVNPKGKEKVKSAEDIVDNFHALVVDSVDRLFEQTDTALDLFLGRVKAPAIAINAPIQNKKRTTNLEPIAQASGQLFKPQQLFQTPIDNSDAPWVPNLRHKFHAMVPLGYAYHDEGEDISEEVLLSSHPYRYEIQHISYPSRMFEHAEPIPSVEFAPETLTRVSSAAELHAMIDMLKRAKEIAVDLEHHSYRTYAGFLCLMQISTRERDFVIDTLTPDVRAEMPALGEVFADPNIVKVFHGADSDIVWLQQDFNLYIVNLFDTFHASKILEFPRHGLANLLEMYCDFIPDKRYQLADWRIRPLPDAMLDYARSDTHFLLYVYDHLRNALLDRAESRAASLERSASKSPPGSPKPVDRTSLIREVLSRSEATALRRYVKEGYDFEMGTGPNGWDGLAKKWNKGELMAGDGANVVKREIFRSVHQWRDKVAREDDESTRYVLPHHILFAITERPPEDIAALFGMWRNQNNGGISSVVKKRAAELVAVIREAKTRLVQGSTPSEPTPIPEEEKMDEVPDFPVHIPPPVVEAHVEPNLNAKRLWGSVISSSAAPTSRLLTGTTKSTIVYKSLQSSLLGNTNHSSFALTAPSRFSDVVARIHSTLQIAATLPRVESEPVEKPAEPMVVDGGTGMQVEIPFVPMAQRTTKLAAEPTKESDSIVVVGQARQKKKRTKQKRAHDSEGEEAEPSTKKQRTSPEPPDEVVAFDFDSVPNMLDDTAPALAGGDKKKLKKKKGGKGGTFYGDFPAPPKARSEPKSGNQSVTFSK